MEVNKTVLQHKYSRFIDYRHLVKLNESLNVFMNVDGKIVENMNETMCVISCEFNQVLAD